MYLGNRPRPVCPGQDARGVGVPPAPLGRGDPYCGGIRLCSVRTSAQRGGRSWAARLMRLRRHSLISAQGIRTLTGVGSHSPPAETVRMTDPMTPTEQTLAHARRSRHRDSELPGRRQPLDPHRRSGPLSRRSRMRTCPDSGQARHRERCLGDGAGLPQSLRSRHAVRASLARSSPLGSVSSIPRVLPSWSSRRATLLWCRWRRSAARRREPVAQ